ncbi:hypothetical protein YC2023_051753 [Brassica napus]
MRAIIVATLQPTLPHSIMFFTTLFTHAFEDLHNHIKSSAVIVTEPDFNAKICHFGTAKLCGETDGSRDSRAVRFEGVIGYMSPEFQASGVATQESDVFAFGVMMLELLSGEEPLKYRYEKSIGDFERTSVIETAKAVVDGGDGGDLEGRLRRWMDRRLGDSFPVKVVEKLMRLALECVEDEAVNRPEMGRVAGKISQLYLESEKWIFQPRLEARSRAADMDMKNIATVLPHRFNSTGSHTIKNVFLVSKRSYHNYLDVDSAWNCVSDSENPTCAVMKHTNLYGEAYRLAVIDDPCSTFGGIVVV